MRKYRAEFENNFEIIESDSDWEAIRKADKVYYDVHGPLFNLYELDDNGNKKRTVYGGELEQEEEKAGAAEETTGLLENISSLLVQKIKATVSLMDELFTAIHIGTEKECADIVGVVRLLLDTEVLEFEVEILLVNGISAEEYVQERLVYCREAFQ